MKISKAILALFGWKVEGYVPADIKKFIVLAVPHTSGWDVPLGILSRLAIGREIKFIGKRSLFKPPFGGLLKAVGGYPIDRDKNKNQVQTVVEVFDQHEEFAIAISPEGTRSKVEKFKTGFYYIAKGAKIPIVFASLDYGNRKVKFDPEVFYPTDDVDADLAYIWNYYKGVKGKITENSIT